MSYFQNNKIYDVYSIDGSIFANEGDIINRDFIEIFNNEEMVLDFSKTNMICSNGQIKSSELHKIKVDWGDGSEDVVVKDLSDKGSSIGTIFHSWKRISHLYNTDKRNVYLTEDIKSLPTIVVHFYNTYNDVIKMVIPFKLVYKSLYDLNCQFDLIASNVGNDYLTTFVFKESKGDSLSVVQNVSSMVNVNYEDNIVYIKDKTVSVDYSEEFVDEDNVMWAWDQIPYVTIKTTCDQYYPVTTSDFNNHLKGMRCEFIERTVPIETWKPHVTQILDEGNKEMKNIIIDENSNFLFYVFGGDKNGKYKNLDDGLYKVQLEVTGINDVSGLTSEKIVAVGNDQNFSNNIILDSKYEDEVEGDNSTKLNYTFTINKDEQTQWAYFKNCNLFLKPKIIDTSDNGLGTTIGEWKEDNWEEADESLCFTFPLNLDNKDGKIEIFKKSLPNGKYYAWCTSEDLLGNIGDEPIDPDENEENVDKNSKVKHIIKWEYNNIGDICTELHEENEILFTNDYEITENGREFFGKMIGDYTNKVAQDAHEYEAIKISPDTTVISWYVKNPSEMDKIQFKLEKGTDVEIETSEPNPENPDEIITNKEIKTEWEVIYNEKKAHDLWDCEDVVIVRERIGDAELGVPIKYSIENFSDWDEDKKETVEGEKVTEYHYNFHFPHANYDDGTYKATMSHVIDMSDYMGVRKKETEKTIELEYNVPKITIDSIEPFFKYNKTIKMWSPYLNFNMSSSKNDIADTLMTFTYPNGQKQENSIRYSNKLQKPINDCFKGQTSFDVFCTSRDAKDYIFRRIDKNPAKTNFTKNASVFLKCHTSLPDFEDVVDAFGEYVDDEDNEYTGIDLQTETAVDVFRTHKYEDENGNVYFKYKEPDKEPNYFYYTLADGTSKNVYSYFMAKQFTPVKYEGNTKKYETEKMFKRIIQADIFDAIPDEEWKSLQSTAEKFTCDGVAGVIPLSYEYMHEFDNVTIKLNKHENSGEHIIELDEPEDILYSNLKLYKDGNLVREMSANEIKTGIEITDVTFGDYSIELEYSSINTNTVDSNKLKNDFNFYADITKVLTDVNVTKNNSNETNENGENLYTITFNWKQNHKLAKDLILYISTPKITDTFFNAHSINKYTPPINFTDEDEIDFYFTMTSDYIQFPSNLNKGKVYVGKVIKGVLKPGTLSETNPDGENTNGEITDSENPDGEITQTT